MAKSIPGEEKARETPGAASAASELLGASLTGLRATAFVADVTGVREILAAAAGMQAPFTLQLTCKATGAAPASPTGGHGDFHAITSTGAFQFFATSPQHAADFALIAHRVAELALLPGICGQDFYETTQSVQSLVLPDQGLAEAFLGKPGDHIPTPSPAQEILWGAGRTRIPKVLDLDQPAGIGCEMGAESLPRAAVGQHVFIQSHLAPLVQQAFEEFAQLTGREYAPIARYRTDDAHFLVLCMGAISQPLQDVVDVLREAKIKVGVASILLWRPFPAADLSQLLAKSKAVTILERSADAPISREIRGILDKVTENSISTQSSRPFPELARLAKLSDRPAIFTGLYGLGGGLPRFGELAAAIRNMTAKGGHRRFFVLGDIVAPPNRRYPHLQALQQQLAQDYPDLSSLSLAPTVDEPIAHAGTLRLESLEAQGALFAANTLAQALAEALGWNVRTEAVAGLGTDLGTASLTLSHSKSESLPRFSSEKAEILLVVSASLLETTATRGAIRQKGHLIVATDDVADDFWRKLSRSTAQWMQSLELRVTVLKAAVASGAGNRVSTYLESSVSWALMGAALKKLLSEQEWSSLRKNLFERIARIGGEGAAEDIAAHFDVGAGSASELDVKGRELPAPAVAPETEAPWTLTGRNSATPVFDRARFWRSVGYLYDSGVSEQAATDPFLASGILPAGSSAFRDLTSWRLKVPRWLPENCTGCAACWAQCPDMALPASVNTPAELIDAAVSSCAGLVQIQRIQKHLAQQVSSLVAADDLGQFSSFKALLEESFARLMDRMKPTEDERAALEQEFAKVREAIPAYVICRTEEFFDSQDKEGKRLLTIAVDPMSCTACGLCLEACTEKAFEWAEQSDELLMSLHADRKFQRHLPAPPMNEPVNPLHRLLDQQAYFTLVGGDGSLPGNGAKTAVHLVTAAVHSVMRSRTAQHARILENLIERVRDRIQGGIDAKLKINDFESFAERLSRVESSEMKTEALLDLIAGKHALSEADIQLMRRLGEFLSELERIHDCYRGESGARAPMMLVMDRGGSYFWSGTYPYNPHSNPWVSSSTGELASLARGVMSGIRQQIRNELAIIEGADRILGGILAGEVDEAMLLPPVVVVCEMGSSDPAMITELLNVDYPTKLVILNPDGSDPQTNILALARQHQAFALQSSIAFPEHLVGGVVDSLHHRGATILHVHAPNPSASGIAPDRIIETARMCCAGRGFPLFRFDSGELNLDGNPAPLDDWATHKLLVRSPAGVMEELRIPMTVADWAVTEARFQGQFRHAPAGERGAPLAEYLRLSPKERIDLHAFVRLTDRSARQYLAILSPELIVFAQRKLDDWRELQRCAADEAIIQETSALVTSPPSQPLAPETPEQTRQRVVERLLGLSGYSQDPDFFHQSLRQYLDRRRMDEQVGTEP